MGSRGKVGFNTLLTFPPHLLRMNGLVDGLDRQAFVEMGPVMVSLLFGTERLWPAVMRSLVWMGCTAKK